MNLSRLSVLSGIAIATVLVTTAFPWHASLRPLNPALSAEDQEFIINAEEADIRQRALALVVEDRSEDPMIRGFAAVEARDHSNALHQLGSIMRKYGMRSPVAIVLAHPAGVAQLEGFCAKTLDDKFLTLAVENHLSEIELLKREAASGADPEVKRYARNALPQLQTDLSKGRDLQRMQSKRKDQ